jgi:hypothetical protein
LHLVIAARRPAPVVQAVLAYDRSAAGDAGADGKLPLQLAIEQECDVTAIQALIAAHPAAAAVVTTDGKLMLSMLLDSKPTIAPDMAVTLLAWAAPAAAGTDGRRALHLVIAAGRPAAVVQAVLGFDEKVAGVAGADGKLPLQLAIEAVYSADMLKILLLACPNAGLQQLVTMGFERRLAIEVFIVCKGQIEDAVQHVGNRPDSLPKERMLLLRMQLLCWAAAYHPRLGQDSPAAACGSDLFDHIAEGLEQSPRTWLTMDGVGGGWKGWLSVRDFAWWTTQLDDFSRLIAEANTEVNEVIAMARERVAAYVTSACVAPSDVFGIVGEALYSEGVESLSEQQREREARKTKRVFGENVGSIIGSSRTYAPDKMPVANIRTAVNNYFSSAGGTFVDIKFDKPCVVEVITFETCGGFDGRSRGYKVSFDGRVYSDWKYPQCERGKNTVAVSLQHPVSTMRFEGRGSNWCKIKYLFVDGREA